MASPRGDAPPPLGDRAPPRGDAPPPLRGRGFSGCALRVCQPTPDEAGSDWVVEKRAPRAGPPSERLLAAAAKQARFRGPGRAPAVFSAQLDAAGVAAVRMAFEPCPTAAEALATGPPALLQALWTQLEALLAAQLAASRAVPLEELWPAFAAKRAALDGGAAELPAALAAVPVPVGPCHGDLTLCNLMLSGGELVLLDFLDPFVESPLQDIAKLQLDAEHGLPAEDVPAAQRRRLLACCEWLRAQLEARFSREPWWPAVALFREFALARMRPYVSPAPRVPRPPRPPAVEQDVLLPWDCPVADDADDRPVLVVPAAGESSRFPGVAPKWRLAMPSGRLMVAESVALLDGAAFARLVVGVRADHVPDGAPDALRGAFADSPFAGRVQLVVLGSATRDVGETLARVLRAARVPAAQPVVVKDCDNAFALAPLPRPPADWVAVHAAGPGLRDAAAKSYAVRRPPPAAAVVESIVEKAVVSDWFCCGAYGVASSAALLEALERETAMSDVLWRRMLLHGAEVQAVEASEYADWGTLEAWEAWCSGGGDPGGVA